MTDPNTSQIEDSVRRAFAVVAAEVHVDDQAWRAEEIRLASAPSGHRWSVFAALTAACICVAVLVVGVMTRSDSSDEGRVVDAVDHEQDGVPGADYGGETVGRDDQVIGDGEPFMPEPRLMPLSSGQVVEPDIVVVQWRGSGRGCGGVAGVDAEVVDDVVVLALQQAGHPGGCDSMIHDWQMAVRVPGARPGMLIRSGADGPMAHEGLLVGWEPALDYVFSLEDLPRPVEDVPAEHYCVIRSGVDLQPC